MADLVCGICGDDTGADHVNFSYPFWKRALFMAGKGCENCEGVRPPGLDADQLADRFRKDEDENDKIERIERAFDGKDYSDEWVEPPPEVLAKCSIVDCGTKVEVPAEEVYALHDGKAWVKAVQIVDDPVSQRMSVATIISKLTFEEIHREYGEEFHKLGEKVYCDDCTAWCHDCNVLFPETETVFHQDEMFALCNACEEKRSSCSRCEALLDEDEETDDEGRGPCCADEKGEEE